MAKVRFRYAACAVLVSLLLVASVARAADEPDYNGKYCRKSRHPRPNADTIEIVQSPGGLDITTVKKRTRVTNHYPLDGSYANCFRTGAEQAKCAAHFEGRDLFLQQNYISREYPQPARVHREEHWQLSADKKQLRIDGHSQYLDAPHYELELEEKDYIRVELQ
jgi:hypothetical protein